MSQKTTNKPAKQSGFIHHETCYVTTNLISLKTCYPSPRQHFSIKLLVTFYWAMFFSHVRDIY